MANPAEIYFPADPPSWDFVRDAFPLPLAITCTRLLAEMERQEPVAAAWALRDAFECLIKFSASLAVADFLHASPDPTDAGEIAELLLKPSGLSVGDWHTLLEKALDPLKPLVRAGHLDKSNRILPSLFSTFFETKGRSSRTALNNKIGGQGDTFAAWRNRVFGHGVFSQDRNYYAQETLDWLPTLGDFYAALRPILADRRLVSRTPSGDEVIWQGAGGLPLIPRHEHEPWGDPLPMFLAPTVGSDLPSLLLTPFLSMQQCQSCGQPAAFFFDKNKYDRKQGRHATAFLEYFSGHPGTHKNWIETRRVAALLPSTFDWERTSYDAEEVDGSQEIVFRDFDAEYLRPDYLIDAVWQIAEEQMKGYIHVVGPGGMGKTYFVRGLAAEGQKQEAVVLPYHILPGARTDAQTFVLELHACARDKRFRTPEPQMKGATTAAEMQAEFASYLSELKHASRNDLLVIAIDALDELADPADRSVGITDCLPPPDLLPDGCFFVLTSREELRPKVRADVTRLQSAAPDAYTPLTLGTGDATNQGLLRLYLWKHLPLPLRTPETIDAVLVRCGGIFLYAFHLCRALEAGVFPDITTLPDGAKFYPAYLERLRIRVGDHLYETVYLPTLLLLCAAQQPVTLDQLARWGVPRDRLQFALLDLSDFLRVHRELPLQNCLGEPDGNNRYEMAHEEFIRFVQSDTAMSQALQVAHTKIAHVIIYSRQGQWPRLTPAIANEFYDLSYLATHIRAAQLNTDLVLRGLEDYVRANMYLGGYREIEDGLRANKRLGGYRIAHVFGEEKFRFDYDDCDRFTIAVDGCKYLADHGHTELPDHFARFFAAEADATFEDCDQKTALLYDWAIDIWKKFEHGKDAVSQANLASALVQCGIVFRRDSELDDAVIRFDKAIPILRRLLNMEEINQVSDLHDWEVKVIADLLNALQYSFMIHYYESEWDTAGESLSTALPYIAPFLSDQDVPKEISGEIWQLYHHLASIEDYRTESLGLTENHEIEVIWEHIYRKLDEKDSEVLNNLVEWTEKQRKLH